MFVTFLCCSAGKYAWKHWSEEESFWKSGSTYRKRWDHLSQFYILYCAVTFHRIPETPEAMHCGPSGTYINYLLICKFFFIHDIMWCTSTIQLWACSIPANKNSVNVQILCKMMRSKYNCHTKPIVLLCGKMTPKQVLVVMLSYFYIKFFKFNIYLTVFFNKYI